MTSLSLSRGGNKSASTRSFKVHEDQKATIDAAFAKAREQFGAMANTSALEFICIDFLGSQSLPQRLKSVGLELALQALEKAFPGAEFEVKIAGDAA